MCPRGCLLRVGEQWALTSRQPPHPTVPSSASPSLQLTEGSGGLTLQNKQIRPSCRRSACILLLPAEFPATRNQSSAATQGAPGPRGVEGLSFGEARLCYPEALCNLQLAFQLCCQNFPLSVQGHPREDKRTNWQKGTNMALVSEASRTRTSLITDPLCPSFLFIFWSEN